MPLDPSSSALKRPSKIAGAARALGERIEDIVFVDGTGVAIAPAGDGESPAGALKLTPDADRPLDERSPVRMSRAQPPGSAPVASSSPPLALALEAVRLEARASRQAADRAARSVEMLLLAAGGP